jgi:uncharacterized protein (DUF433 family)
MTRPDLIRHFKSRGAGRAQPELRDAFHGLSIGAKSDRVICMNDWIVADQEHLGGNPRVRNTRISVALILESLAAGMTISDIVDAYPSLSEEAVRGVLAELARRQEPQPA